MTKKVHIILQGKGGVGKSMVAACLAQYKRSLGEKPLCIDTDPVNSTFEGYAALDVKRLHILSGDEIDTRNFDQLIEMINESTEDVIIDNGASSFVALSHYLISNEIPEVIRSMDRELLIHCVITGGQAILDTVSGFAHLASQFKAEDGGFIVWLNPFFGEIALDGVPFEDMKAYKTNVDRVLGTVKLPALKKDTFERDFSDMLQDRLTFDEAMAMPGKTIMVRQRLKVIQRDVFNAISGAVVV